MTKQSKFFSKETGCRMVTMREVIIQFLEKEAVPCSVRAICACASWMDKDYEPNPNYVRQLCTNLTKEGWIRRVDGDEYRFEYVGDPALVVKPKEAVREDGYIGNIVPPRVIEFVPYVPEPEPAYRRGAFDFTRYQSKGPF